MTSQDAGIEARSGEPARNVPRAYRTVGIGRPVAEYSRREFQRLSEALGVMGLRYFKSSLALVSGPQLVVSGKVFSNLDKTPGPDLQIDEFFASNPDMLARSRGVYLDVPLLGLGIYEAADESKFVYAAVGDVALPGFDSRIQVPVLGLERRVLGGKLELPVLPAIKHEGSWASAIAIASVVEFSGDLADAVGTVGSQFRHPVNLGPLGAVYTANPENLPQNYLSGS